MIPKLQESSRRDQVTIMTDLLLNMEEPIRFTHILYKSNMSYTQLVKYLDNMIDLGLAQEKKEPHRSFRTTDKGKLFIKLLQSKNLVDLTPNQFGG